MIFKRHKSAVFNQRGFTFIELIMVIGILGMLSAIAVQQIKFNRENAYDRQAQAMMRNLLTYAAVDEPAPPGGSENQNGIGGGLAIYGYPEVEIPTNVYWNIMRVADRWQFWFAHPGGQTGFYFWVPGGAYSGDLNDDGAGNRSDKMVANAAYRPIAGIP
jgi:prepilin-type N-terminal cleavage/methylation domain-containing protein